jgi:hypothetical protein
MIGRGSEFVVRLPLLEPAPMSDPPRRLPTVAEPARKLRVVIVEDNSDSRGLRAGLATRPPAAALLGEHGEGSLGPGGRRRARRVEAHREENAEPVPLVEAGRSARFMYVGRRPGLHAAAKTDIAIPGAY